MNVHSKPMSRGFANHYSRGVKVVLINIDDLVPHEDVDRERFRYVLYAVKKSKLIKPILVDNEKNMVIDGHHRLEVLKALGMKVAPAILVSYKTDIERIGYWVYVGDSNRASHTLYRYAKQLVEELERRTKRGNRVLYARIGGEELKIYIDAIDLYLSLKDLMQTTSYPYHTILFKKVPYTHYECRHNSVCIVLPELTVGDIYVIGSKSITMPPRTTYHRTNLKKLNIFIPLATLEKVD